MRKSLIILALALSGCVPVEPEQPVGFVVLRCNERGDGGRFIGVLNVRFPDATFEYPEGEDGLTRQISFDRDSAIAYVRARHPDRTAGRQGFFNDNCGRRRESVTDDGD
ncbi:MAG: hypothetical protein AAF366_14105 [Pseudomonadota bacterium]